MGNVKFVFKLGFLFEREIKSLFLRRLRLTRQLYLDLRDLSLNKATNDFSSDAFKENPIANKLFTGLLNGNRASLASAITLVETEHKEKKKTAQLLLEKILKYQYQSKPNSYRIGFSGPPGAGKSTFIEVFGKYLTSLGHKVAVLAVDPSSETSGGSLLGDKTRMTELTRDVNAFIRPSPAKGHLGGVTRSTNEAIILCEFTGYDVIIIETVGVGQSEFAVTNMVDLFILLLPPGGGDELQGVKRGIIERANILVVTKSDGDLKDAAHRTQYEYTAALKFLRSATPNWKAKVLRVSSRTKEGIDKFWETVNIYRKETENDFLKKRGEQRKIWMWAHVQEGLKSILFVDSRIKEMSSQLQEEVKEGKISPGYASDKILSKFKNLIKSNNIK